MHRLSGNATAGHEALLGESLAGLAHDAASLDALGDSGGALFDDELDVSRRRHVRANAAVSTVCAAAHLRGAVDLDVGEEEGVDLEALGLGVGLSVTQEVKEVGASLDRPSSGIARGLLGLALSVAATATGVAAERDSTLVAADLLEVGDGLEQLHALDSRTDLAAVLVVNAEVGTASLAALGGVGGFGGVTDHFGIENYLSQACGGGKEEKREGEERRGEESRGEERRKEEGARRKAARRGKDWLDQFKIPKFKIYK